MQHYSWQEAYKLESQWKRLFFLYQIDINLQLCKKAANYLDSTLMIRKSIYQPSFSLDDEHYIFPKIGTIKSDINVFHNSCWSALDSVFLYI